MIREAVSSSAVCVEVSGLIGILKGSACNPKHFLFFFFFKAQFLSAVAIEQMKTMQIIVPCPPPGHPISRTHDTSKFAGMTSRM